MQRGTTEEQLILKAIKEELPWESLSKRLQASLCTREEWHRKILEHCIKKRIQWNSSFARKVSKESDYYEEMMRYLRRNYALFPYHLADYICRVMRVSPFRYYCDMIFEVMKNEQPYDSIPNFSAADALRLTGIGRNEFIDIMNKCRSKKIMWKLNKSIAKESLPTQPVEFSVEPWWGFCLVNFTLEEFKKLSEEETATIDKVCKEGANTFILFDPEVVKALYIRGLVYFDVPVNADDRFKVSRLEGFVSNREQSYEDPIEELLYAVFVVSSENATVAELAATLQADLKQLQAAASFACRLGWADKVIDPAAVLRDLTGVPSSPGNELDQSASHYGGGSADVFDGDVQPRDFSMADSHRPTSSHSRVAFIVDANITSYLMMGSVSPGLKFHAVTLYEAGKLGHASIAELCKDLSSLEGAKFEGELQEFANHAFSLRCVLECLQSGGVGTNAKTDEVCNKNKWLTSTSDETTSLIADISLTTKSQNSGLNEAVMSSDEFTNSFTGPVTGSRGEKILSGKVTEDGNSLNEVSNAYKKNNNDENRILVEGSDSGEVSRRRRKKYHVDILRCESLASLTPVTLDRLFTRDYDIVVSIVPLPQSSILPGPTGPVHFGPPSRSSMTPWMKLVLYLTVASGPLSVVLMKGQCFRLLPAPLAGCEKAFLWSWDGSTIGGLGTKFEGNLVKGSILLHCLNSLLKQSAVLVLPLSRYDLDESGRAITMDIPLPLRNSDGSVGLIGKELGLCEEESSKLNSLLTKISDMMELCTVGYIRVLKLFTVKESDHFLPDSKRFEWVPLGVEFGIPLFSPKLCNNICKRIVASQLLQADTLADHHDSMQSLQKKLSDICAEYQSTGPAAKLLYQKEQPKETSHLLMNYASGRWNPLVDPSSSISGASGENQRSKLVHRNRFLTEVLSFDGSVLRSYAMTPVYEAPTRPIEDSPTMSSIKPEPDDSDSKEVPLPGVNLIFDGADLKPFDIGACQQARQPVFLIAEAVAASASFTT